MPNYRLIRLVLLSTLVFFSVIVLALGAAIEAEFNGGISWLGPFASLGIASAVLTWAFVITNLVIGRMRSSAFVLYTIVDVAWAGFLWIMWLATAGDSSSIAHWWSFDCNNIFNNIPGTSNNCDPNTDTFGCIFKRATFTSPECHDKPLFYAFIAFSWFCWITIFAYFIFLVVFSVRAHMAGDSRVWFTPVADAQWGTQYPSGQPPQQQYAAGAPGAEKVATPYGGPQQMAYGGTPSPAPQYPPHDQGAFAPQYQHPAPV